VQPLSAVTTVDCWDSFFLRARSGAALLSALAVAGAAFAQTVSTDKPDYGVGETVIITGAGWQPGETVSMVLTRPIGPSAGAMPP